VAKKAGLAGKTEAEEAYADVILEHVNDFIKGEFFSSKYLTYNLRRVNSKCFLTCSTSFDFDLK
jgi:hypothetical protein